MRGAPSLAAESGAPIHGTLRLAAELQGAQPSGAVLFLIARTAAGGPPLAVKRIEAPRFPLDFEIGPDDRMIKSMPFAGSVLITARLDTDGNATSRTPGDLQGAAGQAVSPGASGVEIVIDQKL
jgi:cytochrome c-type biogenesis protein CcmH